MYTNQLPWILGLLTSLEWYEVYGIWYFVSRLLIQPYVLGRVKDFHQEPHTGCGMLLPIFGEGSVAIYLVALMVMKLYDTGVDHRVEAEERQKSVELDEKLKELAENPDNGKLTVYHDDTTDGFDIHMMRKR